MIIRLQDISKRYTTHWILKKINFEFEAGVVHSIQGPNGSGKSTLMQIISTRLSPTLGTVEYSNHEKKPIDSGSLPFKIAFAAPYVLPLENLSIKETFRFYSTFRTFRKEIDYPKFIEILDYPYDENKLVKNFSSGMKQRLLLAFTLLSKSDLILLDEPTSFLDAKAKEWYHHLLQNWKEQSSVIISTNDPEDLQECTKHLILK